MKTCSKYVVVVLFNLVFSVLCEPEEPLDRGMWCYERKRDFMIESSCKIQISFLITGWGENIKWKTFDDGLKEAKKR